MKNLIISEFGSFLGVSNQLLSVRQNEETKYYPLTRLASISIARRGVGFSSNLIASLSKRGIKLFFLDFRGVVYAALLGESQHGVVAVRMAQMDFCRSSEAFSLAKKIVTAKIKNQRAVINYFSKYHHNSHLTFALDEIKQNLDKTNNLKKLDTLLGMEGASAKSYFQALREAKLFSSTFVGREGRGSKEINNTMLNFGYAVLSSYVLNAITNAGIEPYLGIFHGQRPGKMALVLDLMEEYRSWVVDRAVIKLRYKSEGKDIFNERLKISLIKEIQSTFTKKYPYQKKKVKLEHVLQRQVYRLAGHFSGRRNYRPYLFKW